MFDDAFAHFEGEIEAGKLKVTVFEQFNDAKRVKIVVEAAAVGAHEFVEFALAGVPEGRMADIVNERKGFSKFAVQTERRGNRAGDLGHFEGVRQAIAEVVGIARGEDLGLGFEPAESPGVN